MEGPGDPETAYYDEPEDEKAQGGKILGTFKAFREALPGIQERALQTGDYSEVQRASDLSDRLQAAAEQHIGKAKGRNQYLMNALNQAEGGYTVPSGHLPAMGGQGTGAFGQEGPEAQSAIPTPGSEDYFNASSGGVKEFQPSLPDITSVAHEAARGAVKGAVEAHLNSVIPKVNETSVEGPETGTGRWDQQVQPEDDNARIDAIMQGLQRVQKPPENGTPSVDDSLAGLRAILKPEELPAEKPTPEAEETPPTTIPSINPEISGSPTANERMKNVIDEVVRSAPKESAAAKVARRIREELGPDPTKFDIGKALTRIFTALGYGAGQISRAWLTSHYEGGMPLGEDLEARDYRKGKQEIAKEVYSEEAKREASESLLERAMAAQQGAMERTKVTEAGKTERAGLAAQNREQVARIRAASTGAKAPKFSATDQAEINRLKTAYNGLDHTLMTVDPKVARQGKDYLDQMEAIIETNRAKGN